MDLHRIVPATTFVVIAVLASCSSDADVSGLPTSVQTEAPTTTVPIEGSIAPCDGDPGVGGAAPDGAAAGDLVAASELDPSSTGSEGFPTDATVRRMLYVSTGVDEDDLQLVCGLAAAPAAGPADDGGTGHMLARAHGTIGLQQACLPSAQPETSFWGPMGAGIGAVAWGSGFRARKGDAADGALQTALDRGWVVSAADYQPNDTYIMGRIAAANVIDSARATTQLMDQHFGAGTTPDTYDTIAWGHSQGGHAALWTGQLFEEYQQGAPSPRSAALTLAGIAAEAPATNLIAQPERQPGVEFGDGLADWEMHKSIQLIGLLIPALELQIGPALFSYIFGSWTQFSALEAPAPDAALPAYPPEHPDLDLDAVATPQGATTIAQVQPLCLNKADSSRVKGIVAPYRDAAANPMLVPSLWNVEEGHRAGQFVHGGVDEACATTTEAGLEAWCAWIRWNLPGPLGEHPFPKVATRDGVPVPVLIAQGADDEIIRCVPADGAVPSEVTAPADCMNSALFETLRDDAYCPDDGDRGYLRLSLFRADGAASPASHLSIPGQIAAVGSSTSSSDLSFRGSPLDRFMTGAFDGRLEPGCSAGVLNAD